MNPEATHTAQTTIIEPDHPGTGAPWRHFIPQASLFHPDPIASAINQVVEPVFPTPTDEPSDYYLVEVMG
jgi:hypothetical protein